MCILKEKYRKEKVTIGIEFTKKNHLFLILVYLA